MPSVNRRKHYAGITFNLGFLLAHMGRLLINIQISDDRVKIKVANFKTSTLKKYQQGILLHQQMTLVQLQRYKVIK